MNTWQPITHADQHDVPADLGLRFELSEDDVAKAAAARYYIEQHRQRLNARAAHTKEQTDA